VISWSNRVSRARGKNNKPRLHTHAPPSRRMRPSLSQVLTRQPLLPSPHRSTAETTPRLERSLPKHTASTLFLVPTCLARPPAIASRSNARPRSAHSRACGRRHARSTWATATHASQRPPTSTACLALASALCKLPCSTSRHREGRTRGRATAGWRAESTAWYTSSAVMA
jgi:hypothetical protein